MPTQNLGNVRGPQGIQGIQGPQGVKGDTGATGETGAKGDTGDIGPQGAQGVQGEQGVQGIEGPQGIQGDKGDAGLQGIQGVQGLPGSDASVNATNVAAVLHAATSKATPVDADEFGGTDSAASFGLKRFTWAAIKATLSSIFVSSTSLFNSDERFLDSFATENTTTRFRIASATGTGASADTQSLAGGEGANINFTAAATTAAIGAWTDGAYGPVAVGASFSRYTAIFHVGGLYSIAGQNSVIRFSLFANSFDVQGAAPTAKRLDLVITGATTAHFETWDTSLHVGPDFTTPDLSVSGGVGKGWYFKFVVSGGVAKVYMTDNTAMVPVFSGTETGSYSIGVPTAFSQQRAGIGVHASVTGTSAFTRSLSINKLGWRIVK